MENARQQHNSHRQEMDQLETEYSRVQSAQDEYEKLQNKKSKEQGRSLELEDSQVSIYLLGITINRPSFPSSWQSIIA